MPYCEAHSSVSGSFLVCGGAPWCIADTLMIDSLPNSVKSLSLVLPPTAPSASRKHAFCGMWSQTRLLPPSFAHCDATDKTNSSKQNPQNFEEKGLDLGYHGTIIILYNNF